MTSRSSSKDSTPTKIDGARGRRTGTFTPPHPLHHSTYAGQKRPITFDKSDHPDHVIEVGRFPLVVTAMINIVRMMKILMDGGSGINILCRDAFDRLKIDVGKLHASQSPFHGIMPGRRVMPLGTIAL